MRLDVILDLMSKDNLEQLKKNCETEMLRLKGESTKKCDDLSITIEQINQRLAK